MKEQPTVQSIMALADAYATAHSKTGLFSSGDVPERATLAAAVGEAIGLIPVKTWEEGQIEISVPSGLVIPPITDCLGAHWRQPAPDRVRISPKLAIMSNEAFLLLSEYSSTLPSGVYAGKMWRCFKKGEDRWYLVWFGYSNRGRDDECSINQRPIHIHPSTTQTS